MIKKIDIFLVLLLLLLSIGAVSASEDLNDTISSDNEAISDIAAYNIDDSTSVNEDAADEEILTSTKHIVNSSTYSNYFNKGNFISSSINAGDTLQIDGNFKDTNFTFRNPVKIVGTSTNNMKNCVFSFYEGASGSTISNLKITNTKTYYYGIFLNGASNCTIQGCIINNTGSSSYTICVANNANYNTVSNNVLNTYGSTYGHGTRSTPPVLLCNAHYNHIENNYITCEDANAIYLSSFEGGPLKGGVSTFNTIFNNTIKYTVLPTSWAYGIQVMGGHNTIDSNEIIGAYRGISTSEPGNVIINNRIINLTGADYNNPGEEIGGEIAIVASYNATVKNNVIINAKIISTGAGISALDNSVIENNYVQVLLQGKGMHPQGSNITIKNNTIITESGSGILYNTHSYNLVILNNNITSQSGIGVLIQKVSNKRMPGNITIVGNSIATSNKYAIDALEANASSNNVIGPNNIKKGNGEVRTPEGTYDPSKPSYVFNGTVHNINPSNYADYINDNGGLSSDIKDGDILNFTGEFSNKKVIFINSAVKITGNNPVFYNTTFRVLCDGVWIENLKIRNNKADRINAWGVHVYRVAGVTVSNCDIEVYDPNAAYAIYVVESSDVDVLNNNLSSSGNYLTYTLLAYAVEDCNFINNTIYTVGTAQIHTFEGEHGLDTYSCLDGDSIADGNHVLNEVYRTYGILMAYSSDNVVSGNKVNATSKLNKTVSPINSTNSIVGIDSYFNCQNNVFSDNDIYIKANDNYIYGMGVLGYTTGHNAPEGQGALNNQFINNNIELEGTYYVDGIIIGWESYDSLIEGNTITLDSSNVAYGIVFENSQRSTLSKNDLTLNSDVIYSVEAFSSNGNVIDNNNIEADAKKAYGLIFSNSNNNTVTRNTIFVNGSDEKIGLNFDSIPAGNAGIFLKTNSTKNEIKKNTITSSKGYAIIVDDEAINNTISENCLDSEKGIGNAAVNNTKNNVVENNYRYTFSGRMTSVKVNYLETALIKLTIDDGANVKFYINNEEIGNAVSSNGVATLNYKIDKSFTPGSYKIKAVATKDNYLTKEFSTTLKIEKANLNVVLNNISASKLTNATFVATVSDGSGNPVSGVKVKFYRIQGRYVYVGEATTNSKGIAKLVAEIPSLSADSYVISANVTADDKFNAASGQATLINKVSTKLTAKYNSGVITATLKDNKGNAVSGVNIGFTIGNNVNYVVTDENGQAKYSDNSWAEGNYNVKVAFDGYDSYMANQTTVKFTLSKIATTLAVSPRVSTTVKSGAYVLAMLKDANGNAVKGAKIGFVDNDKVTYVITDGNGRARCFLDNFTEGKYNVKIAFFGNDVYEASNKAVSNVVISKVATTLAVSRSVSATVNSNSYVLAMLKDANGNAVKGAKIGFVDKDKVTYVITDGNGRARCFLNNFEVGTYNVKIAYFGDSMYKASNQAISKVTITKT